MHRIFSALIGRRSKCTLSAFVIAGLCMTHCSFPVPCKSYDITCSLPATLLFYKSMEPVSWLTFLGGSGADTVGAMIQTTDGGYVVVGQASTTFGSPVTPYASGVDIAVVKLDRNGNRVWNTFAGGTGTDIAFGVTQTLDGNIVVTGSSDVTFGSPVAAYAGGATPDIITLKFDRFGNRLWHTYLGGASNDSGQSVAATADGGAIVNGPGATTFGSPIVAFAGGTDFAIIKYDINGNRVWNTFLGGAGSQDGYSVSVVPGGDILVSGVTNGTFGTPVTAYAGGQDLVVARYDANGNLIWLTFAGSAGNDFPGKGSATSNGGYILIGHSDATWGTPVAPYISVVDLVMVQFNSSGGRVWNTFLGGASGSEIAGHIVQRADGSYCGTGMGPVTIGAPLHGYTGANDILIFGLNSTGALLWTTFFGGTGNDQGNHVVASDDGGCAVAGVAASTFGSPVSPYTGGNDFAIVKLFANGTL